MNLSHQQRALLSALADVLIPAGAGLPSASQADVAGHWLNAVLAARPDLENALKTVLDKVRHRGPHHAVADLRASDPAAFEVLAEIVPGAYFMNPDVQRAIGYAGQSSRPMDPRPDYLEDDLLDSVIRRGPIYRPTPTNTR
jgi:hypothetical protein